jgi:hypothetical protein
MRRQMIRLRVAKIIYFIQLKMVTLPTSYLIPDPLKKIGNISGLAGNFSEQGQLRQSTDIIQSCSIFSKSGCPSNLLHQAITSSSNLKNLLIKYQEYFRNVSAFDQPTIAQWISPVAKTLRKTRAHNRCFGSALASSKETVSSIRCQISAIISDDAPNNDLNLASFSVECHPQ